MKFLMKKEIIPGDIWQPTGPRYYLIEELGLADEELAVFLQDILTKAFDGTLDPDLTGRSPDIYISNLFKGRLGDFSRRVILIARDSRHAVGILIALPNKHAQMHITSMGVVPSHRRQGLAGSLLGHFLKLMQEQGHNEIVLDVHQENTHAMYLYLNAGFKILDR